MAYRDERIRVTLSIGVASAVTDGREAIGALLALAQERATQAHTAGGNRVVAEGGEVDPAAIERELARVPSVDGALRLLRAGARDEVAGQLPELVGALLPLLELLVWCLKSKHQIMVLAASATDAKMVSALLCHTNGLGSSL